MSARDHSLPCCELLAVHKVVLHGDFVTAEVTTSGDGSAHRHGIRAPRHVWSALAARIESLPALRTNLATAAAAGEPLLKPGGHAL